MREFGSSVHSSHYFSPLLQTGEPYESSESSNESDSDDDDDKSEGHDADSDEDSESSDSDSKTFATAPPRRTGDEHTNDGREKGACLSKNITIEVKCVYTSVWAILCCSP